MLGMAVPSAAFLLVVLAMWVSLEDYPRDPQDVMTFPRV